MKVVAKVVYNYFPRLIIDLDSQTANIVRKTTYDIQTIVQESMQGSKSGRLYPRAGGNVHQASAPGEAPAIDYGVLVNSIQTSFDAGGQRGYVFTNTEYAVVLEFGGSRMAARPFMRPAAEAAWPGFEAAMRRVLG